MEENKITDRIPQQPAPVVASNGTMTQLVRGSASAERVWVIPAVLTLLALSVSAAAWLGMSL